MMKLYSLGPFQTIIVLFVLLVMYLPIVILLIDIYRSKFRNHKWTWFMAVLLFNYIGAILYLLIGRQQKIKA